MKLKSLSGFIIFFIFFIIICLYAQDNWTKEFTKEEISVYTRPVDGSPLKEFKGEGMINASLEVCENVMEDIQSQTKWRPDCIEAKLLKEEGNVVFLYNQIKAPWPVSNRDVIVRLVITKTKDKIEHNFTAIESPEMVPVKDGVVRMTNLSGSWILVRRENETFVTYQSKVDPAGSIPTWLANSTSIDQPFKSLKGLRDMVKESKYQAK